MKIQDFIAKHFKQLPWVTDISRYYPLPRDTLEKYREKLDWNALLMNPQIQWDIQFLEQQFQALHHQPDIQTIFDYVDHTIAHLPWSDQLYLLLASTEEDINFGHFSANPCISWSAELIAKYQDKWDWHSLSDNPAIPFTKALLLQYSEQWHWGAISSNPTVPFDLTLIETFKDKWFFENLNRNPGLLKQKALLKHCQAKLNWEYVSHSSPLFKDIENFYYFQSLIQPQHYIRNPFMPSLNKNYLYETLSSKMESERGTVWSDFWRFANIRELLKIAPNLLEDFETQVNFEMLSNNHYLPMDIAFFEKYQDRLDWDNLSSKIFNFFDPVSQTYTGWPMEFIERFASHWDWSELAMNIFIQWELNVILKNFDKVPTPIWQHPSLPVSEELLDIWDRFFDDLYWDGDLYYLGGATRLLAPDEVEQILKT